MYFSNPPLKEKALTLNNNLPPLLLSVSVWISNILTAQQYYPLVLRDSVEIFHNLKCHKLTLWMWRRWHAMKAWQTLLARGCLNASWLETCREALKSFAGEQSYFSCLTSLFFQASFVILSLVKPNCSSRSFCGSSEGIGLEERMPPPCTWDVAKTASLQKRP